MSSGFISESEALEARRRRQEEWDKVRTEDQPKEAPEEVYDTRPLFQRLEEQRLRKDAEYEEAHKLKNMIRGLDDDEVGFLDLVERSKATAAMKITAEEQREMNDFRERVSVLAESAELQRLRAQVAPARTTANNGGSRNKLQGVVVRKRKASEVDEKQDKEKETTPAKQNGGVSTPQMEPSTPVAVLPSVAAAVLPAPIAVLPGAAMKCVGVLPGLGDYSDSDTSDSDSDHSEKCCAKRDLLGRLADEQHEKRKQEAKS